MIIFENLYTNTLNLSPNYFIADRSKGGIWLIIKTFEFYF